MTAESAVPAGLARPRALPWGEARGWLAIAALAAVPLLARLADQPFWTTMAARIAIFSLAALSLGFILGRGGLVSFGHAAFLGIGAYAVGIGAAHGLTDAFAVLPLAIVAGAGFAALTGLVVLRTRGVPFIMITLAFAQMAFFLFTSLSAYGGDDGLSLPGRSLVAGLPLLRGDLAVAYAAIGALALGYALLVRLTEAPFGVTLLGLKENEQRLMALGVDPFRHRLAAYVVAGALAAVAGALLAEQNGFVSPAFMSWQRSGELLVMVVLGGLGHLSGAILGAAAYLVLEEVLSSVTEHWRIGFGLLLIAVVWARGGRLLELVRR